MAKSMRTMRLYMILKPDLTEEQTAALVERFKSVAEQRNRVGS